MSVPVDLAELAEHLQHYNFAYLLTVGDDQRPHAVAVRPSLDGPTFEIAGLGRRSRANVEARPHISLVWPPFEHGGYSLIVDGHTALTETGLSVTPDRAVLHRPADGDSSVDGSACGSDCVRLGEES